MKKIILFFVGIALSSSIYSQTTLSAGDIAILQYNADYSPHVIKFLALKSMETGTTINFTDNGWTGSALKTNEDTDTWTATSNIKAGDVIEFTLATITLGTGGDQLLAYQGTAGSPTFIFALNNEGANVWQTSGSPNNRESNLPAGLTNGVNAVALTEKDNYRFKTAAANRKGKISLILNSICDYTKWNGHNSNEKIFNQNIVSQIKWTGSAWTSDDSPTGTTDQYFLTNIRADYTTGTDGLFNANELKIRSGRDLTISSGESITIQNSITNDGSIIVEDNASLVQVLKDGPNTGTGYTVIRESTSQDEEGNYTYWSSPLTNSTLAEVTTAEKYYSFTAATQTWAIASSSTSMIPGIGYINTGDNSISYPNTYTSNFTGSPFNNGDISVSLGFTADADPDTDWNLLGNPYPSAIDADTFIADNPNIGGTLYFWTHNTLDSAGDNTQDDYVLWNGTGGTGSCTGCIPPDGNIASGQGFFAQALASGNATFTNSMRVSGNNSLFYRAKQKDRIWLNLIAENSFSQTLIGFLNNATDGVDRIYDGIRLNGGGKINFYSVLEGKNYGIQGKSSFKGKEIIPLGFNSTITGEFQIDIEKIEGQLKNANIVLFDKTLNKKHHLKKSAYTFLVDVAGTFNNRFVLYINPSKIELTDENEKRIKIFLKRKNLHIRSKKLIKRVVVLDIYGNQLLHKKVNDTSLILPLTKRKLNALYIIKVILKNGTVITKKVIE